MKKLIVILLLSFPILVNAQTIGKSDIIGTWRAIDGKITLDELPPNVNQMMKMMIDGFNESTWSFNENGTFRLKFKQNLSPIMEEMKFLDKKLWKLDSSTKQILIGTKEDNYNHLALSVKQVESGMNVYFSDTPIFLTLKKNIK
tara:strand:- start:64 stop:495 length:432 start_codon:yes stop_codon:yes gene_type:complete